MRSSPIPLILACSLFLTLANIDLSERFLFGASPAVAADQKQKPRKRSEAHSIEGIKSLQSATLHMEAGDFVSAVAELTKVVDNPSQFKGVDVAIALKFRGDAYAGDNQHEQALDDFKLALAHPSLPTFSRPDILRHISHVYVDLENLGEARKHLNLATRKNEVIDDQSRLMAARLLIMEGKTSEAFSQVTQTREGWLFNGGPGHADLTEDFTSPGLMSEIASIVLLSQSERLSAIDTLFDKIVRYKSPDNKALPLVLVPPKYPAEAIDKKIRGHVAVLLDVSKRGKVSNVQITESSPPGVFDEAVLVALTGWKFRPKYIEGKAQEQSGVEQRFEFKID